MTEEVKDALLEQDATPAPAEPQSAAPQADPAPAQPDDSAPSDPGSDPADEKPRKRGGGFQNRIDQLTREKYEAELRNQDLQRELANLKSTPTDPGPKPTIQQFQTVEEYDAAMETWGVAKGRQEGRKETEAETRKSSELEKARTTAAAFAAREDQARTRYADYNQVVAPLDPFVRSNPTLAQYLAASEAGPDVAYHLARNPDALVSVLQGDPVSAIRTLVTIEQRVTAPPPPKPTTQAPPPVTPVGARASAPKTLADLADSDDASAYIARANGMGRKT